MLTLGPDFQNEFIREIAIINPNTPNTIWYEYLSNKFYFFLERLACAAFALYFIVGSLSTWGAPYLGDLDLAILGMLMF